MEVTPPSNRIGFHKRGCRILESTYFRFRSQIVSQKSRNIPKNSSIKFSEKQVLYCA